MNKTEIILNRLKTNLIISKSILNSDKEFHGINKNDLNNKSKVNKVFYDLLRWFVEHRFNDLRIEKMLNFLAKLRSEIWYI